MLIYIYNIGIDYTLTLDNITTPQVDVNIYFKINNTLFFFLNKLNKETV